MKKIVFIILIFFFGACTSKKEEIITDESIIYSNKKIVIKVPEKWDNLLQYDSIFEKVTAIPLETSANCLLSSIEKVKFFEDFIFILDNRNNILQFTDSGKFVKTFVEKGKGPGECYEIRDFDIDQEGNVYILDFSKISKYSKKGKFLKTYKFYYSPKNIIQCNPLQFALCGENNFYIWGGSFSIKENKNRNLFVMYKMNYKGEITGRYFPLNYKIGFNNNQFSKYDEDYIISPYYGCNIIYAANDTCIYSKYQLDFGKFTFKESIPENFLDLGDFKAEVDQKYANNIRNIVETEDWLYFTFNFKGYLKNVYYSKKLDKAFVSLPYPRLKDRVMPWKIFASDRNYLVAFIEPSLLLDDLQSISNGNNNDKLIKEVLEKTTINDNYIMLKCLTKKY